MNLDKITRYMMDRRGWSKKKAERTEVEYRKFLSKAAQDTADLVPSPEIDEMWHAHILHTEHYSSDCIAAFGRIVHHRPIIGGDSKCKSPAANTKRRPTGQSKCKSPRLGEYSMNRWMKPTAAQ